MLVDAARAAVEQWSPRLDLGLTDPGFGIADLAVGLAELGGGLTELGAGLAGFGVGLADHVVGLIRLGVDLTDLTVGLTGLANLGVNLADLSAGLTELGHVASLADQDIDLAGLGVNHANPGLAGFGVLRLLGFGVVRLGQTLAWHHHNSLDQPSTVTMLYAMLKFKKPAKDFHSQIRGD